MVGQVGLAWYLTPSDFGKIGTATLVAAFAGILQQTGSRAILIHRQAHFRRWASPVFGIALATSGVSAMAMLLSGLLIAHYKAEPVLAWMMGLLAVRGMFDAASSVPQAFLQSRMRFKALSIINLIYAFSTASMSVIFARFGWGPLSYAMSFTLGTILQCALIWFISSLTIPTRLQLRRWRFLLGDSSWQLGAAAASTALSQGDYLAMSALRSDAELGNYYYAYNLSTQTVQLIGTNFGQVLFPSLAQMQGDPIRQTRAFVKAAAMLAVIAMPFCFLQAIWASPILSFLYHGRWDGAVRPLQVLSIGMAFLLMGAPSVNLFWAQGRFRAYFWWSICCAANFLLFAALGAATGGATSVAISVTIFNVIFGPMGTWFAIRSNGGVADLVEIYIRPAISCMIAFGISVALSEFFIGHGATLTEAFAESLLAAAIYIVSAKLISRRTCDDLIVRIRQILKNGETERLNSGSAPSSGT